MRQLLHLLILLAVPVCSFAQAGGAEAHEELGDEYFAKRSYAQAIKEYELAAEQGARNEHVTKRLAHSYRFTRQPEKAALWYAQVVKFLNGDPENMYYYAEALKSNGKYPEAEIWMDKYLTERPGPRRSTNSNVADFASKFTHDLDRYRVRSTSINTPFALVASSGPDAYPRGHVPEAIAFVYPLELLIRIYTGRPVNVVNPAAVKLDREDSVYAAHPSCAATLPDRRWPAAQRCTNQLVRQQEWGGAAR